MLECEKLDNICEHCDETTSWVDLEMCEFCGAVVCTNEEDGCYKKYHGKFCPEAL